MDGIASWLEGGNEHMESLIIHEITHWFTKQRNRRGAPYGLDKLFTEGISMFAECATYPESFFSRWHIDILLRKFDELVEKPGSTRDVAYLLSKLSSKYHNRYYYVLGFYMWVVICAYKIRKEEGRECFEKTYPPPDYLFINIDRIRNLVVHEKVIPLLITFRSNMTPAMFFKEYVEATKKMGVRSIFNKETMESLIEVAKEGVAKRKRAIETRKANRNLLKLSRHLKQRDMEEAKRKRAS